MVAARLLDPMGARMPNRPVHFDIQVDNTERAMEFYSSVFGWEFQPHGEMPEYGGMYYGVVTGDEEGGINGGMHQRESSVSSGASGANAFVVTMIVDDFDAIAEKILAAGGSVLVPKSALEGMAWQGYFADTEGNTFGIHQVDENAK